MNTIRFTGDDGSFDTRIGCMLLSTIVTLTDVDGQPSVRTDLPGVLLGQRVRFGFKLRRQNGGRMEILDATGEWRVTSAIVDATGPHPRQLVSVESARTPPPWKAIKKTPPWTRRLPPARSPRTVLA